VQNEKMKNHIIIIKIVIKTNKVELVISCWTAFPAKRYVDRFGSGHGTYERVSTLKKSGDSLKSRSGVDRYY
jgi:hypothetical protein